MLFVDSNIWCYYFDQSAKEHPAVATALDRALAKDKIVLNTVVVMEVAHYLVKNLGPVMGLEKLQLLETAPFIVHDFDGDALRHSIEWLATYSHAGVGGRDATILATMASKKIKRLMTHDAAFKRVEWIEAVDPAGSSHA